MLSPKGLFKYRFESLLNRYSLALAAKTASKSLSSSNVTWAMQWLWLLKFGFYRLPYRFTCRDRAQAIRPSRTCRSAALHGLSSARTRSEMTEAPRRPAVSAKRNDGMGYNRAFSIAVNDAQATPFLCSSLRFQCTGRNF